MTSRCGGTVPGARRWWHRATALGFARCAVCPLDAQTAPEGRRQCAGPHVGWRRRTMPRSRARGRSRQRPGLRVPLPPRCARPAPARAWLPRPLRHTRRRAHIYRLFGTNVVGSGSADRGLEVPSRPCGHGGGFGTAAAPHPVSVGTVRRRALPTPPLKSVCAVATQGLAARGGVTGWVGHHVSQTDLPPLPRPETPHHSGRSDLCAVATLLACRQVVGASDIGGRRGVGARALSAPARSAGAQASRACLPTWGRA